MSLKPLILKQSLSLSLILFNTCTTFLFFPSLHLSILMQTRKYMLLLYVLYNLEPWGLERCVFVGHKLERTLIFLSDVGSANRTAKLRCGEGWPYNGRGSVKENGNLNGFPDATCYKKCRILKPTYFNLLKRCWFHMDLFIYFIFL